MSSRIGSSFFLTRVVGMLPERTLRQLYYRYKFGRIPNLEEPQLFSELIQHRMLRDRSDQMAWTCDKLKMKEYARRHTDAARVPETLWSGRELDELASIDLPDRWVLKPNHRSQAVYFGSGAPNISELKDTTRGWLRLYERAYLGEWAYRTAERCFLVEEQLDGSTTLNDYKIFVFNGVPRLIQVDSDRFTGHKRRFYSVQWDSLDYTSVFPLAPKRVAPRYLSSILKAASDLGNKFDFVRVDFYDTESGAYFGEITPYPGGGMEPFKPEFVDRELGEYWLEAIKHKSY